MEVKIKKLFHQKIFYDPKLDDIQNKVKSPIKEQKFNEMLNRLDDKMLEALLKDKTS